MASARINTDFRQNAQQAEELLDYVDQHAVDPRPVDRQHNRREARREPFRTLISPVTIEHPGGGIADIAVYTRNLSARGMAFIHAGFLHPGSGCAFRLIDRDGRDQSLKGVLRACRHIKGVIHESSVEFGRPVEVHSFITPTTAHIGAVENFDLSHLRGAVLHLDDNAIDRRLVNHYLRETSVELISVQTFDEAMAVLREQFIDVVLCDLNLDTGVTGVAAIAAFRDLPFDGPVVAVTAESERSELVRAQDAGATEVICKPFQAQHLQSRLIYLSTLAGAVIDPETLYSSMGDRVEMEESVSSFVTYAGELADQIEKAILSDDFDDTRMKCLQIKGSAQGHGFAPLGEVARDAIRVLDRNKNIREARPQLRRLLLMCRNITVAKEAT